MSHLSSQTFKTLIQIFSHCREFDQPPKFVSFSLSHPDSFLHDDGEKATGDNECESGKFVGSVNVDSEEKSVQEHRVVEERSPVIGLQEPNETGTVIEEIARLMSADDDVDVLSQNDLISKDMEEDNRPNTGSEKMMIDELERIVKDSTTTAYEMNSSQEVRLDDNNCAIVAERNESNNQEENLDLQRLDVSELDKEVQDDGGCCHQKDSEAINLSSKMDVVGHLSKTSENEETHILKSGALETENGMRRKNGDGENLVDSSTALSFPQTNTENGEKTEEGEICSGHVVDEMSVEMSANMEKIDVKSGQGKVSKDDKKKKKNKVKFTKQNQAIEQEPDLLRCPVGTVENISHGGNDVTKKGDRDKAIGKQKSCCKGKSIYSKEENADGPNNLVKNSIFQKQGKTEKEATSATRFTNTIFYGDIWNENSTKEVTAVEKDSGVNKKKRKQRSEESKMRKKKKERIKRAKKNRELGVKRLKLFPIEKPKTVVHCRHYLQGRCHEGEKCKFSHDTVPLTKSKPCLHFARQSCMKGGDCPFDHDLSKYPCHSYSSKGSCPRGKDCLFSHKIVSKEDAAVAPVSTDMQARTPPSSSSLSSGKQPDILASQRNIVQKKTSYLTELLSQKPERSAVDTAGKPLWSSSIESKVDGTPSKNRDIGAKGQKVVAGTNSSQILKTPSTIPKGINFLSFGKTSLGTLASPVKSDGGRSTLEKSLHEQDGAIVVAGVDKSTGSKVNQSLSEVTLHCISREMPTATLPLKPQKSESRPFGRSSSDDGSTNKQAHPPASCSITDSLVGGEHYAPSKTPSLSSTSQVLSPPPPSSGQSSGHAVFGPYKNISNSAQKAISSTLAFAARCEREMKKNQSVGNFASDTRANKESNMAGPLSDSAKALKILDFLSGIGKKKS